MVLADCILTIDGEQIALSRPSSVQTRATPMTRVSFGITSVDGDRVARLVGKTGVVQTRSGVVLMRLRLVGIDPALHVLTGEPVSSPAVHA